MSAGPSAVVESVPSAGTKGARDLPMPAAPRYQSLDFWRGVACLLVIVFHATFYQAHSSSTSLSALIVRATKWFWIGVPMFFVISGYCITASADRLRRREQSVRIFAWR